MVMKHLKLLVEAGYRDPPGAAGAPATLLHPLACIQISLVCVRMRVHACVSVWGACACAQGAGLPEALSMHVHHMGSPT